MLSISPMLVTEKLQREEFETPPRERLLRYNLAKFAEVVRDGIRPPCGAEDGIRVQEVIEAMLRSMARGKAVDVERKRRAGTPPAV